MDKNYWLCHSVQLMGTNDEVLIVVQKEINNVIQAQELLDNITKERNKEEKYNNEKFILLEYNESFVYKKGGSKIEEKEK